MKKLSENKSSLPPLNQEIDFSFPKLDLPSIQIPDLRVFSPAFDLLGESILKANAESIEAITKIISTSLNGLSDALRSSCSSFSVPNTMLAESFQEAFAAFNNTINLELSGLIKTSSILAQQLAEVQCVPTNSEKTVAIDEETAAALQEVASLVPDGERKNLEIVIAPAKKEHFLSLENLKWLLGVLVPIIFALLLRTLPDEKAEENIQLQREQNAIEQRENELREAEVKMLAEFLDYLEQSGVGFPAQVDSVAEDVDTIDEDINAGFDDANTGSDEEDADSENENAENQRPN